MDKYTLPLEERKFYHIYNQGNNGETLFYNDGNYVYFMQKLDWYLSDYLEIYAFCLMPNHFHLLVRIKALEEISEELKGKVAAFKPVRWGVKSVDFLKIIFSPLFLGASFFH